MKNQYILGQINVSYIRVSNHNFSWHQYKLIYFKQNLMSNETEKPPRTNIWQSASHLPFYKNIWKQLILIFRFLVIHFKKWRTKQTFAPHYLLLAPGYFRLPFAYEVTRNESFPFNNLKNTPFFYKQSKI